MKSTHISQLNSMQNQDQQKTYNVVEDDDTTVIDALNHLNKNIAIDTSMQMPAPPPQIDQNQMSVPADFGGFYEDIEVPQVVANNMRFFAWAGNDDIKTAIYVVIVFIVVSIIPIETTIYKYISLDKIPYSSVLLKAIIAGILVFILKKLLK